MLRKIENLEDVIRLHGLWLENEPRGVKADLSGTNLREADLSGTNLRWAKNFPPIPIIKNLDQKILETIGQPDCSLDMGTWHKCETTHCRAGWAIHLAGEAGYALEEKIGSCAAGALIYHAAGQPIPDFYASNEDALADIKAKAKA